MSVLPVTERSLWVADASRRAVGDDALNGIFCGLDSLDEVPEDFAPPPPPGPHRAPSGQYPPSAWAQPGVGSPPGQYPSAWNQPGVGAGWGQPTFAPPNPAGPRTSGLAVAALALGLLGLVCSPIVIVPGLAVILGWRALGQIKGAAGLVTGRGLAITGIITGVVGLTAGIAVIVLLATGTWMLEGGVTRLSGDTSSIAVGDCLELPDQGTVRNLTEQPCGSPHQAELIYRGALDGPRYPGEAVVQNQVESFCSNQFETYVGRAFDDSRFEMLYIYPLASTWTTGDREYLCMANEPNGAQLAAGTVKGSKR